MAEAQAPSGFFKGQISIGNLLTIITMAAAFATYSIRGDARIATLEDAKKAQDQTIERMRVEQSRDLQTSRDELRSEIRDVNTKLDHVLDLMMRNTAARGRE